MKIKFFIAEDSSNDLNKLTKIIKNWSIKTDIFVDYLISNKVTYDIPENIISCDVALIDIEIPEISGIEFAKQLRKMNKNIIICFITSHNQYAINGYEVSALDYILKPVNSNRFTQTLCKIEQQIKKDVGRMISFKAYNGYYIIDTRSLIYIESDKHSCIFHMVGEEKIINISISQMEILLSNHDMYRVHRSYIINLNMIRSFNGPYIQLNNGDFIPVSRSKMKEVKVLLLELFGG